MTSGAHLNESLINGMFNQSRMSDASLTISEESRLEPRALGSLRSISPLLHNHNHNHHNTNSILPSSLNTHHNPLNNSILLLAKSQLQKFNECVGGLSKKTQQIQECFHKIQTTKKKNVNTKVLKKKATQNIDVLKQEIMISRTSTSNKLKLEFQNLKTEYKKNQMELKKLQSENEKMKSMKDGLLSKELRFQTEKKKMEGQQERLEIQRVMENMLAEVEKGLDLQRVINENKLLSTKIQTLNQQIQKSKQQQYNLLDKTRLLQQKLKISQTIQLQSHSQSLISFQNQFQLCPTQTQISDLINTFSLYIQNIQAKLSRNANFYKPHLKNSNIHNSEYLKQLQNNSLVFAKIVEYVKRINIGKEVKIKMRMNMNMNGKSGVMGDISNLSNGQQYKGRSQSDFKNNGNRGSDQSKNDSNHGLDNSHNHKNRIIKEILVASAPAEQAKSLNIIKEYRILKIENRNLKEVNKVLKAQLMAKMEENVTVEIVSSSFTHNTPSSTPPTSTPPTFQAVDMQEKCKHFQKKYKMARIEHQQLSSQLAQASLRERKIQFQLTKERGDKRKLHNEIQDMRGNIRIYCRICPRKSQKNPLQYKISSAADTILLESKGKEFRFDAVYGQDSSQEEIFQDTKRLIHSSIEGHNVSILACGQTGSGKTYTLSGDQERPGISIRSIQQIFCAKKQRKQCLKIDVYMSILEINIDNSRDLLFDNKDNKDNKREKEPTIPQSIINTLNLSSNYTFLKISTADQGTNEYKKRIKERGTSSTLFNHSRFRSHLILILVIETENYITKQKCFSKFTIIDLGGSQSLPKPTLKTQQQQPLPTNSSLLALKSVMIAPDSKDTVNKYRQNRLMPFLIDSFSKNTKTLIFVNISSDDSNQKETLMSLQLVQEVKKVNRSSIIRRKVSTFEDSRRSSKSFTKPYGF